MPPLVLNNNFVTNFQRRLIYFTTNLRITSAEVSYKTVTPINHINISIDNIIGIINKMSTKKAGGYDGISITMLPLCAPGVALPLQIIFQKCMQTGTFPDIQQIQVIVKQNPIIGLFDSDPIVEKYWKK